MDFSIKTFDAKSTLATAKAGCIAVGVYEGKQLSTAARLLDSSGALTAAVKAGDISGKAGTTLLLRGVAGIAAERILLVGLGKENTVSQKEFGSALRALASTFANIGANDALVALPLDTVKEASLSWAINSAVQAICQHAYRFDELKSKPDKHRSTQDRMRHKSQLRVCRTQRRDE